MVYIKEEKNVKLEEIQLTPQFVIKTKLFSPYKTFPSGSKLFINVCTNNKIPTKKLIDSNGNEIEGFHPEVMFVAISNVEWEIPILTCPKLRNVLDKKGNKSLLIDCVINDMYMKWCMINEDLKDILIQWCFDAVEFQIGDNFIIDRDIISIPKRSFIGDEPPNISVDLQHLNNISHELENLSKDMKEGLNEHLNIINAKRLDFDNDNENSDELPPLIPEFKKSGLIVEIDEQNDKVDKQTEVKKPKIEILKPEKTIQIDNRSNDKSKFNVILQPTSQDTKLKHSYEIKITSPLYDLSKLELNIDTNKKELILLKESESIYSLLLPLNIRCEDITSFYVLKEKCLYIYLK
jgi:hypothetical protein